MKWINLANELLHALHVKDLKRQAEIFAIMDQKKIEKQKRKVQKQKAKEKVVLHEHIM